MHDADDVEPGEFREAFFAHCFTSTCCPRNRKASRRFELSWWAMVGATSSAANCGNEIEVATYAGP
jgi:hypothetical protein